MPVYIYDKDAFRKMMIVEGGGFRQNELDFVRHQCSSMGASSFFAFYQKWQEMYAQNPEFAEPSQPDFGIVVNHNGAIYGFWGWNRYSVRTTGEIIFLRYLSRDRKSIEKAAELGFRIFPEAPDDLDPDPT